MNKPEKKTCTCGTTIKNKGFCICQAEPYNQACDDWEKYHAEEVKKAFQKGMKLGLSTGEKVGRLIKGER